MDSLPDFLRDKVGPQPAPHTEALAYALVDQALKITKLPVPLSERLAACFDLLVASKFYQQVVPEGWLWCGHADRDYYTFLNACPYCALHRRFVQHDGHKPGSGQIGPATALAFREVVAAYLTLTSRPHCQVCDPGEPIDFALVDFEHKAIFIAEVKAAPLFTPPLARRHTSNSMLTQQNLPLNHTTGTARLLHEADLYLFIPDLPSALEVPVEKGIIATGQSLDGPLADALLTIPEFLPRYFLLWQRMWQAYQNKDTSDPLYWSCGACGLPSDVGEGWPRQASGKRKGSISDGKTSVGTDRTDDIKKATFQVLKLGVDNRSRDYSPWRICIGLASNVHAARHYEDYLRPYEDIVWGWSTPDTAHTELYNLFDGIVSFTRSHIRDQWLACLLDWTEG